VSRSFRHWSPAYLTNRLRERFYRRMHPGLPWLSPQAIKILEQQLQKTDVGLEFGSGRSTLWFARRVSFLTSVEHNAEWHRRVKNMAIRAGTDNLECLLVPKEDDQPLRPPAYARSAERFVDGSLDFILVDGIYRDFCANASIGKLRSGGLLILDDAHRYVPSASISPYALNLEQEPASPGWARFVTAVGSWRCQWTSNGVSDTAIYFKP
jgi:predicted O-methyltransferase YrrM